MKKVGFLAVLFLFLMSCDRAIIEESMEYADQSVIHEYDVSMYSLTDEVEFEIEPPRTHSSPPPPPPQVNEIEKSSDETVRLKIIKNAEIVIEVDSLENAKTKLDLLLEKTNGYYVSEQYKHFSSSEKYILKIKVPYQSFDELVNSSKKSLGRMISKNEHAKDVSREYYDLELRLKTKKAFLEQYRMLLSKAVKVKEMIEIQEKIRVLEEEIESSIGQMRFYDRNVKYSTIDIVLHEIYPEYLPQHTMAKSLVISFEKGLKSMWRLLLSIISLWPFVLGVLVVWLCKRRILSSLRSAIKPRLKHNDLV